MDFFTEEKIVKAYEKLLAEAKKKECPDGHEWDEKTQECLPSSTGIKEAKEKRKYTDEKIFNMNKDQIMNFGTRADQDRWFEMTNIVKKIGKPAKWKDVKKHLKEEKKECPEGHEWDEKLQECLPSSTGIKESAKKKECPDGHEWDEELQECLPSSTGIKESLKKYDTGASKKADKIARAILQLDAFKGIKQKDVVYAHVARLIDREIK